MQFQSRIYRRGECITFLKTTEHFGGLSNMAGGYPLLVNNVSIFTSEALYQSCRFPHKSDLQKLIISQKSPMTAKMKSKPYRKDSRSDWDEIRVQIMWWCLRVKLAQHWGRFGKLLLSTGDMFIVEESYRDEFWGARPTDADVLVGFNVLGQLLTHLRERLKSPNAEKLRIVSPLPLPQFFLMDKPIEPIKTKDNWIMQNDSICIDQLIEEEQRYSEEKKASTHGQSVIENNVSTVAMDETFPFLLEENKLIQLAFNWL